MKNKKIKIPTPNNGSGKIPQKATELKKSTQSEYPVFSFKHVCDNHCLLSDWNGSELKDLIETLKTMESLTWNEIFRHSGLRYKAIDSYSKPLPAMVSPEETICEIRVCQRKRILGYRFDNVFRIIWFDREHEICPMRKRA